MRYKPGDRIEAFTLLRRVPSQETKWEMRCDCGAVVERRTANITAGKAKTCGDRAKHPTGGWLGPKSPLWTDAPTYAAAHSRVKRAKGAAREHTCADCGETAGEWSYVGDEAGSLRCPKGRLYSGDVSLYVARCLPCHRRLDARRAA